MSVIVKTFHYDIISNDKKWKVINLNSQENGLTTWSIVIQLDTFQQLK